MTLAEEARRSVLDAGLAAGLSAAGTCTARAWDGTRAVVEARRRGGLADTMAFTYRNPVRSTDPSRLLRGAATLFVGATGYAPASVPAPESPASARVGWYATDDFYAQLRAGLDAMAGVLRRLGFRAVVVADDNGLVDREAAWRAGLGWYGRNSLLLSPKLGSWTVLGSVVTDASVAHVAQPMADRCGACTACRPACPTGAIGADRSVDARRCLAWIVQRPGPIPLDLRSAVGDRVYGCDECQEACPPNQAVVVRLSRSGGLAVGAAPGRWIDAAAWLLLGDDDLAEAWGRWYLPARDVGIARRNLLVVLGNSGAASSTAVVRAVRAHVDHPDPVVAEQARWSAERLGMAVADADAWHEHRRSGEDGAP